MDINVYVSLAAAIAAAISAATAFQANRNVVKADRERRVRELSVLARKVVAIVTDVGGFMPQLKMAYDAWFSRMGRGGSGIADEVIAEVTKLQESMWPMNDEANDLLSGNLDELSDELITQHLVRLSGHLVHVERTCRRLEADLASVEAALRSFDGGGHPSS